MSESATPGWRDAVMDQVYLRSFADGTGDEIGDPPGVRARLPDDLGTPRARAMLLLLLALPESVFLDQSEELRRWEAEGQPDSVLAYYRAALATRRTLAAAMAPTLTWLNGPEGVLAFSRGTFACMVNLSDQPVTAVGPVLLSSAPVVDGLVPPDVAVWTSGLPGADQAAQHTVHEGR